MRRTGTGEEPVTEAVVPVVPQPDTFRTVPFIVPLGRTCSIKSCKKPTTVTLGVLLAGGRGSVLSISGIVTTLLLDVITSSSFTIPLETSGLVNPARIWKG